MHTPVLAHIVAPRASASCTLHNQTFEDTTHPPVLNVRKVRKLSKAVEEVLRHHFSGAESSGESLGRQG